MSAVKYHGEYPEGRVDEDGKPFIVQHGYTFGPGASVQVKEAELVKKFAANRFFEVSGKSDKDDVEAGKEEAEKAEAESLRAFLTENKVPFHHKTGLDKLRTLRADYEAAQAKAQD